MFNLGLCYMDGDGVEKDPTRAAQLYQLAVNGRNVNAMNNLGVSYQTGQGVEQDFTRAAQLYADNSDLVLRKPPFPIPSIDLQMIWSPLLQHDEGHRWFRQLVADVAAESCN